MVVVTARTTASAAAPERLLCHSRCPLLCHSLCPDKQARRCFYLHFNLKLSSCSDASFPPDAQHLTYVHILDLHKDGVIKPHIDSIRYCGDVITGVCLLSDAVMRLRHKDRKNELIVDLMLPRRCLYRMGEEGRYEFTHEVLSNEESMFNGQRVEKTRRISIICRDLPHPEHQAEAAAIKMKPIPEAA